MQHPNPAQKSLLTRLETYLVQGDYTQIIDICEREIQAQPDLRALSWYLGLTYLLQDQADIAEATWLFQLSQGSDEELEAWIHELSSLLHQEAFRQRDRGEVEKSWLIREWMRSLDAQNLENIGELISLAIQMERWSAEVLAEFELEQCLTTIEVNVANAKRIGAILEKILPFHWPDAIRLAETSFPWLQLLDLDSLIRTFQTIAVDAAYKAYNFSFAAELIHFTLKLAPNNLVLLGYLPRFYMQAKQYQAAIASAKLFLAHGKTNQDQLIGQFLLLQSLMNAGAWNEVRPVAQDYQNQIQSLFDETSQPLDLATLKFTLLGTSMFAYIQDDPTTNRGLTNRVARALCDSMQSSVASKTKGLKDRRPSASKLKLGYIGHTFRAHSVGWLCRWLLKYHDRDRFDLSLFLINQTRQDPFFQSWFADERDSIYECPDEIPDIAEQIHNQGIDILVDLDCLTLDITCAVLALKPSPIQVSWLGSDASGLPSIDYFLADPYVLPTEAEQYYQENLWRLPQTYLAVDGFEVDVPTLRREDLEIPEDAIVFFSAQSSFKRHPDTIRLQLKVLREVPNSYFLMKGWSDPAVLQSLCYDLAEAEGVACDRIKFLPRMATEYLHRANLRIADIILDTYPYNGATTTLEALWMGIPLVTKVGKQFAARNSYTFLCNAGLTEGIAWTDDKYIEWAVRLAQDTQLRSQVTWKLLQSRNNAPLWNTRQFTQHLEVALQQMQG
jgi:predicted O-linked N-acetylglucosamine transferase (SPINDLY family)